MKFLIYGRYEVKIFLRVVMSFKFESKSNTVRIKYMFQLALILLLNKPILYSSDKITDVII